MAESCMEHCKEMQDWSANPDGFSQTEGGWLPNSEIAAKANKICPGVSVSFVRERVRDITVNPDGTVTLVPGVVKFACQFYDADHGPNMGG